MKWKAIFALLCLFSSLISQGKQFPEDFDRPEFYRVLASGTIEKINSELMALDNSTISEKEAYQGVLLMKKAGLMAKPPDKLKFFKAGRIKLETALLTDSTNGEYHFLRLIIQEHAPRIAKYSSDLEKDRQMIRHTFSHLSPTTRQAIIDYSRKSKILHPQDLNISPHE